MNGSVFERHARQFRRVEIRAFLTLVFLLTPSLTIAEQLTLTNLLGESTHVDSVSTNTAGVLSVTTGEQTSLHNLDAIRSLRRAQSPPDNRRKNSTKPANASEVLLVGGGVLYGTAITMDDECCFVDGHGLCERKLRIPIDYVRAIVLQPRLVNPKLRDELINASDTDRFIVQIEETREVLDGLIEGLSDSELSFSWNDKSRTLNTKRVLAIGIADAGVNRPGSQRFAFLQDNH